MNFTEIFLCPVHGVIAWVACILCGYRYFKYRLMTRFGHSKGKK